MTKKQKRLVIILTVLALLLAAVSAYYWYYSRTKSLSLDLVGAEESVIAPPQFLFSFSGESAERLQRPIGVLVHEGTVYVTDSVRGRIYTFGEDGQTKSSFGASQTVNPLYMAFNPKDGNIYVTDRRRYTIYKYSPEGTFKGEFKPNLPADQKPSFETYGVEWQPIALGFGADGTMYVTEILNGHRLLIFGPDGRFRRSIGTAGLVADPKQGELAFQFPNGIMVFNGEVFVADSNNQRVQVFTPEGDFKRIIVTGGLPRGIESIEPFPGEGPDAPARFVTVDTLAHDVTIWDTEGEEKLSFGEQGVLDGQFSYPGAASRGSRNRIFVADTANGRVQVWGWPAQAAGLPPADSPMWWLCALPLLLLLLPLLWRRSEYFATADFVAEIIELGAVDTLPSRRRRWVTTQGEYEQIAQLSTESVDMEQLFTAVDYSESDVTALIDRYEIERDLAILVATAQRAKLACTENGELRRYLKVVEQEVLDADEFLRRFSKTKNGDRSPE